MDKGTRNQVDLFSPRFPPDNPNLPALLGARRAQPVAPQVPGGEVVATPEATDATRAGGMRRGPLVARGNGAHILLGSGVVFQWSGQGLPVFLKPEHWAQMKSRRDRPDVFRADSKDRTDHRAGLECIIVRFAPRVTENTRLFQVENNLAPNPTASRRPDRRRPGRRPPHWSSETDPRPVAVCGRAFPSSSFAWPALFVVSRACRIRYFPFSSLFI